MVKPHMQSKMNMPDEVMLVKLYSKIEGALHSDAH